MTHSKEMHWERLSEVIRWSNMSTNHFAHHIGLLNSENLYRIKRGSHGISRKLAERIVDNYPQISLSWLISGDGEMFTPESTDRCQINYYEVDVERNVSRTEELHPKSQMLLPADIEAQFAMLYRGDAMGSVTPTNTIVLLRREGVEAAIYGGEYVVQCRDFTLLRYLRAGGDADEVRLVATESSRYDDILVSRSSIEAIYQVVAKLIIC